MFLCHAPLTYSPMRRLVPACLAALLLRAGCGGDDHRRLGDLRLRRRSRVWPTSGSGESAPVPLASPRPRRGAADRAAAARRGCRASASSAVGERLGTIPGAGRARSCVGAHHDTKGGIPGFVGANDGASGVAVLLELARALPRRFPARASQLAFFDAEEARGDRDFEVDGTRGSRQYVGYAHAGGGRARRRSSGSARWTCFDMVGDCELRIPREPGSDPALYAFAAPRRTGRAFGGEPPAIDDDHMPFVEAGVPAVDLIDFSYGPGRTPGAWWHTPEDTLDKVCAESLDAVGEAGSGDPAR